MRPCRHCGTDLDELGKRRDAIYCTGAHRAAGSRTRRAATRTAKEAHRKRTRRLETRVSYPKAVRHMATTLAGPPVFLPEHLARRLAEEGLRAALSERQRAVVEERER